MNKGKKLTPRYKRWVLMSEKIIENESRGSNDNLEEKIISLLLKNRGIRTRDEKRQYFNPPHPFEIPFEKAGLDKREFKKAARRIKQANKNKEKVIVFGDYDVDGICSTAIIWEFLYNMGLDIMPYIPERFSEGYGIKTESIKKLKEKYPKLSLIITVDNGIVAFEAIDEAKKLGIDTIVLDHHEKGERYPEAFSVIHTTSLCGSAISWFFVRELNKFLETKLAKEKAHTNELLELAALGTIADQMSLVGVNRSIVKYGLEKLNQSQRVGLNALFDIAGIKKGSIGVYEVNYIIAPRINAMGRLEHAIDSLRLICTKNKKRAKELSILLNDTNQRRQKIVDEVVEKAKRFLGNKLERVIILSDKSYHEGVIGLAASKLVEEFTRPAIVIFRGSDISKGSCRSISGFNIIQAIRRSASGVILGGGGHELAAGFTIRTKDLDEFEKRLQRYASENLPLELLEKKIKVDCILSFSQISPRLFEKIKMMEPFGIGNPTPTFLVKGCQVVDARQVGLKGTHLKFKLAQGNFVFDAISFDDPNQISLFYPSMYVDVIFTLEENVWNGNVSLQLRVKDIK